MAFCTKCGSKISDEAAFCTVCGATQKSAKNNAQKKMEGRGSVKQAAPRSGQKQPARTNVKRTAAAGTAARRPAPKKKKSGGDSKKSMIIIIICIIAIALAAAAIIFMLLKNNGYIGSSDSKTKTESEESSRKDKDEDEDEEDEDTKEESKEDSEEDSSETSSDSHDDIDVEGILGGGSSASSESSASSDSSEEFGTGTAIVSDTPEPTKTATPTPTKTAAPTKTATPTPTDEPTPTEKVKAETSVKKASEVSLSSYIKAGVSSASASSELVQADRPDISNAASKAVDGDVITSWQEAVNGYGEGEYIDINLNNKYDIRAITFNMGNWRDKENYNVNSRPKDITIWLGSESYKVTIPDGMTQYCVEFSSAVEANKVTVRVDSVYAGSEYDDTCISEITIYSEK